VHAEIAMEASMVAAQAPITLTLSVIPAMVVRSFMAPPCIGSFPRAGFANPCKRRAKSAANLTGDYAGRRAVSESAGDHKGKVGERRWRAIAR
jgi:hypothetical protein